MTDLVDSTLCRLCSDDVVNGTPIFEWYNNEAPLSETINHFLPLQVSDDGKYPRSICPGCHIQLEATSQFFDLLFTGQRRLRELLKEEAERKKRDIKEDLKKQLEEVQKQLQKELTTISGGDVAFRDILFPSDHHLSLAAEGREFPKRKRGRPRKPRPSEDPIPSVAIPPEDLVSSNEENVDPKPEASQKEVEPANPEPEETGPGRRRRKVPLKFESLVQGKELDKILQEQGVVDAEDLVEEDNAEDQDAELVNSEPEEEEEEEEELDGNSETESSTTSKAFPGKRPKLKQKKAKFICDYCDKAFVTQVRYQRHKRTHGEFVAVCTHCNVVFDTTEELEVHQTVSGHLHVILEEPNPSSMPDIENLIQESAKIQEATPTVGLFTCVKCSISFTETMAFKNHVSEYHPKNHRYACTVCGREFRMRQALKRHFTVHTGERPYECKECGMSFKSQANLYTHKNVHLGLRRFVCEICGLGLSHTTALKLHMRWHKGEKPHVCVHCDKRFTQKGNLEEHERTHTGERPYVCEFCHRSFATSSQLKLHSKTHTGEKPYKCEHCGKDFLHKGSFEAHIRRHTGVKPFVCSLCPKSFVDPGALKRHIRSHTGEKPYNCNFCGKNFSDKSNLVKHRKGHKDSKTNALAFTSGETHVGADQELSSVIYVTLQEDEATNGTPNEGNPVATNSFNAQFDSINEECTAFSFSADESALVEAASSDFPETDLPLSAALDSLENVDLEFSSTASENLCDVTEGQKTIQLTTQDGQTLCWVLPAGVDAVQFANEYLNQLQNESTAPAREES